MIPPPLKHKLQSDEILMFFHIPKTAGTSLAALLSEQFPPTAILQVANLQYPGGKSEQRKAPHTMIDFEAYKEAKITPDYRLAKYRLIRGHLLFDPPVFQTRQTVYMTILRQPIERLFSLYQHIHMIHDNPLYHEVKSLSFEQFVQNKELRVHFRDQMTTHILGRSPKDQGDMEEAYKNLERMHYIGITEYFVESMCLLHYTFNWEYRFHDPPYLNPGLIKVDRDQTSPDTYELLQELTIYDQMLYDYGLRIFNERCRKMASDIFIENLQLQQKVDHLMAMNKQLNKDLIDQTRMQMKWHQFFEDFKLSHPDEKT